MSRTSDIPLDRPGEILESRRDGLKLSQAEIERMAGLKPSVYSRFIRGRARSREVAEKIIKALGLKYEQVFGDDPIDLENKVKITKNVPLISYVQAGNWMEACDTFHPGDAEEWIPITKRVGDHAFALRVNGTSMEPDFRQGDIIIVDPDQLVVSGNFVVAKIHNGNGENGEATFKKFIKDGNKISLRPLNLVDHDPIDMTGKDFCIVGKVVSRITEF